MGKINAYKILVGKPESDHLEGLGGYERITIECVWKALVNAIKNLRVP
jgi:hypothetical protein